MIFGFTSTSNDASKNNDMLSKVKRNTNIPNLCFINSVLWILFDLNDTFAPFNNFYASWRCEISYVSVLFIFDFKLHSQRFK